jgi:hypothetical protein
VITIDEAVKTLIAETEHLPLPAYVNFLHTQFRRLSQAGFAIPSESWLNAFELATVAKLVYLNGHGRQSQAFDFSRALNAYKHLWRLAESHVHYSDDPEQLACFMPDSSISNCPFT